MVAELYMHWIKQQAREIRATLKYRKRVARARERLVWWYGVDSRFGGDQDEGSNMFQTLVVCETNEQYHVL